MNPSELLQGWDFWPVTIETGPEFLLVYAVLAFATLAVAKLVQLVVTTVLDGPARVLREPFGYRMRPDAPGASVGIGRLPVGSDILRVAWLRGGRPVVADALIAQASAQGWLDRGAVIGPAPPDAPTELRRLHATLTRARAADPASVRLAALDVDRRWIETTETELASLGLGRSAGTRFMGALVLLGPATLLVSLGVARLVRGIALERPVGFLVVLLVAVTIAAMFLALPSRRTVHADRYLAWLDDATATFRGQAAFGAARTEHDWMLAAALGGAAAVPVLAFYAPPASASGFGGGDSGSSCGSSCGGGCGGCGG